MATLSDNAGVDMKPPLSLKRTIQHRASLPSWTTEEQNAYLSPGTVVYDTTIRSRVSGSRTHWLLNLARRPDGPWAAPFAGSRPARGPIPHDLTTHSLVSLARR